MSFRTQSWGPRLALSVVVLALGLAVAPRDAAAARIPVIYQTGQDAFECGPLPAPFDKEPELAGFQAAYLCDITGVFWTYFSVRNCAPVALKGDTYNNNPELVAAIKAKYPESAMHRGVWNHYGWILLAILIAAGLAIWIKELVTGKSDED